MDGETELDRVNTKSLLAAGLTLTLVLVAVAILFRALFSLLAPGAYVTSWWRSTKRNTEVGGHPKSRHLLGLAVDVRSATLNESARTRLAQFFQVVEESDHVHVEVDWPPGRYRA